jgi:carboxyl-terminal processing protease
VTYRLPLGALGLATALALVPGIASGQTTESASPLVTAEQFLQSARDLRKKNRPEEAIQACFRGLNVDRTNLDLIEELRLAVRQAMLANRHKDRGFHARVLDMKPADVLALYEEVLVKVQAQYVDAEKVNPARLFRQGLDEYLAALKDPNFVDRHLKGADDTVVAKFRNNLVKAWADRDVPTAKQAVEIVAQIGSQSKQLLGISKINPIVCEFICGACNSLDEYSAYMSASQYLAEGSVPMRSTVEYRVRDDGVAYMRITQFQPSTPQEVEDALKSLQAMGGARALILDLRGNKGGLFPAAVKTAEKFLPGGIIVTAQGQQEDVNKVYTSTAGNNATDLPMIVLVNAETASAAEVLAVALRDNRRAKLIGTATFGKGTVQNVIKFTTAEEIDPETGKSRPRAAVRITMARLLGPSGTPITGVGVTPDQIIIDPERQLDAAHEQARELARRYMGSMGMMNGGMMRD